MSTSTLGSACFLIGVLTGAATFLFAGFDPRIPPQAVIAMSVYSASITIAGAILVKK